MFLTQPHLHDTGYTIKRRAIFEVVDDLVYGISSAARIVVPAGYLSDFASVPRFFWRILPPSGWYRWAAVLHDFLYTYELSGCSKAVADAVMFEAMGRLPHVTMTWRRAIERRLIFHAVYWFGSYPSTDIVLP